MTEARDELHRLVEELPDSRVQNALSTLQGLASNGEPSGAWPPAWFGSITEGRRDTSERVEEILAEGFGR